MAYKKGESGNPKGKPKGATDHAGRKIKNHIASFLLSTATDSKMKDIYNSLMPDEKARFIVALVKMVIPPTPTVNMQIDFDSLDSEQLGQLLEALPDSKLDKIIQRIQTLRK